MGERFGNITFGRSRSEDNGISYPLFNLIFLKFFDIIYIENERSQKEKKK